MALRERFDDEEWLLLSCAPLRAWAVTAFADGTMATSELAVLDRVKERAAGAPSELAREVLPSISNELLRTCRDQGLDHVEGLRRVREILDRKVDPGEAERFKRLLVEIAWATANAEGELTAQGDRMTPTEFAALGPLFAALGLD